MRRHALATLLLIIILGIFALIIDLSNNTKINWQSKKLPLINRSIGIHTILSSKPLSFFSGNPLSAKDFSFRPGLDLAGGTSVTLQADMKEIPTDQRVNGLEAAKTVIQRRINLYAGSEPLVET